MSDHVDDTRKIVEKPYGIDDMRWYDIRLFMPSMQAHKCICVISYGGLVKTDIRTWIPKDGYTTGEFEKEINSELVLAFCPIPKSPDFYNINIFSEY